MLLLTLLLLLASTLAHVRCFTHVGRPVISEPSLCTSLQAPNVPGVQVVSIRSMERRNATVYANPPLLSNDIVGLDVCDVEVILTHPGAHDKVRIQVWLPLSNWNGRFLSTGGSGWAAGLFDHALAPAVILGYAAASTDAGVSGDPYSPGTWALTPDGQVNWALLTNFASRSVHEMAVVGKSVTGQFFRKEAFYSYWDGCSTGGRQGLSAAQNYPDDFDGIVAGAPASSWTKYVVAEHWPQVVMKEENTFPSPCELKAFTDASIEACDELDGVKDNILTDPQLCRFDPFSMVGSKVQCDGNEININAAVATVVRRIWDGPVVWYGLERGAPLDSLANTTVINGKRMGAPFFVNDAWIRYFLEKSPGFDSTTIGSSDFTRLFNQSEAQYGGVIGSDNPDLSEFHSAGGKLIVWHGLSDQLIFPQGSVDYRQRVEEHMAKSSNVDDFYRLFLAPGVDHCGGGTTAGPPPIDPLAAVVSWVEDGVAPETLAAVTPGPSRTKASRNICRYPLKSEYLGSGDPTSAESYNCVLRGQHC